MLQVTKLNIWMDNYLKSNLDSLAYNLKHDFDAVILISGSGMVRVGKSVLAQQAAYYLAHKLNTHFDINNIVFSGNELMQQAHSLPKNSVLIYDEARGELDNKKIMENVTKNLLDFFAECGMYNHALILVLPDYFELPKGIAINRSECLLNVIRITDDAIDDEGNEVVKFDRGIFEFYNREGKKRLYMQGKKEFNDYGIGKKLRSFYGEFRNQFVVNKEDYESKKIKHMKRDKTNTKNDIRFIAAIKIMNEHHSLRDIAERLTNLGVDISYARLSQLLGEFNKSKGGFSGNAT
jgi:hypothetical protein